MAPPQVVVVGAGITGSMISMLLKEAGLSVQVIEKSMGAGGRFMTHSFRRGDRSTPVLARADLGAQYVTTRTRPDHPELGPVYKQLIDSGVLSPFVGEVAGPNPYGAAGAEARPSPAGGSSTDPAEIRHFSAPLGLKSVADHFLKVSEAPVKWGAALDEMSLGADGRLSLKVSGTEAPLELAEKSVVVMTQPVPQVLGESKFPMKGNFLEHVDPSVLESMKKVVYSSRYAVAFFFEAPEFKWPYEWAARYFEGGDVRYAAYDSVKRGAQEEPTASVVVHSGVPLGMKFIDEEAPFAAAAEILLKDLEAKMPELPWRQANAKVHKWRYSQVYKGYGGASPSPSWIWNGSDVEASMPGCVKLFGSGESPCLGLLAGDAVAPSSNFEGCVFSAHRTVAAIHAHLAEKRADL